MCRCFFPGDVVHAIHQKKHGYHEATREMTEGETLVHHFSDSKMMKSKYSKGSSGAIRDEEGRKIDFKDNKTPTAEELGLYQLKAIGDETTMQQNSQGYLNPDLGEDGDAFSVSQVPRRRITFHRTESMDADDPGGGRLFDPMSHGAGPNGGRIAVPDILLTKAQKEKKASKPKKSVRILPIVRITVIEHFENYDKVSAAKHAAEHAKLCERTTRRRMRGKGRERARHHRRPLFAHVRGTLAHSCATFRRTGTSRTTASARWV